MLRQMCGVCLLIPAFVMTDLSRGADEEGFQAIFDGKTLEGWEGQEGLWSVKDGAITGTTTKEKPIPGNTFLVWKKGEVGNFELRLKYKIVGGNSGVQYRSKLHDPAKFVVGGYQADIDSTPTFSGILYDERGRAILAKRGQMTQISDDGKVHEIATMGTAEELQKKINKEDWNDYIIIARGNRFTHIINGTVMSDCTDDHSSKFVPKGILALQLHAGPPMVVQFKDVRIKEYK